jgi:hypothetical protein
MIKPIKLPFENTKVNPETTKGEIVSLLKKFGITDYSWQEEMGQAKLIFKTDVILGDRPRFLTVILNPPILAREKRVYDEEQRMMLKKAIPLYSQSYRIMLNYLKAKLTNIALGVVKFEDEFLADIAIPTPEGPKRFADIHGGKQLAALPEIRD